MTRIRNTTEYPIKNNPIANDYMIASDSEDNGKTVNIRIADMINLFNQISDTFATLSGRTITFPDGASITVPLGSVVDTFATLSGRTITFPDNSTIDVPVAVTNTFATLSGRTITFPNASSINVPEENSFSNGITETANTIELGGTLTKNTNILFGGFTLNIGDSASSGYLSVSQSNGTWQASGNIDINPNTLLTLQSPTEVRLQVGTGGQFRIGVTGAVYVDTASTGGIKYDADYSAQYTNRSLVDKAYVDANTTGAPKTFENALTEASNVVKWGGALTGNTTITTGVNAVTIENTTLGGNHIKMSTSSTDIGNTVQTNITGPDVNVTGSTDLSLVGGGPSLNSSVFLNALGATVRTNTTDLLTITSNGKVTAPEVSISEITDAKDLVTKEFLDSKIQTVDFVLTDHVITTASIEILPSPGANRVYDLISFSVSKNITTAYSADPAYRVLLGNTVISEPTGNNELVLTTTGIIFDKLSMLTYEGDAGDGMTLANTIGGVALNFAFLAAATGGVGTITIHATYRIIDL